MIMKQKYELERRQVAIYPKVKSIFEER